MSRSISCFGSRSRVQWLKLSALSPSAMTRLHNTSQIEYLPICLFASLTIRQFSILPICQFSILPFCQSSLLTIFCTLPFCLSHFLAFAFQPFCLFSFCLSELFCPSSNNSTLQIIPLHPLLTFFGPFLVFVVPSSPYRFNLCQMTFIHSSTFVSVRYTNTRFCMCVFPPGSKNAPCLPI